MRCGRFLYMRCMGELHTSMGKLLQIRKYTDARKHEHVEIRLLGIAKMRLPAGALGSYMKARLYKSWLQCRARLNLLLNKARFLRRKAAYLAREEKKSLRRLFITTGNFQMVNALAIIDQQRATDAAPVENHLLVWSFLTNRDFEEMNAAIARACGITHYHSCCGLEWSSLQVASYLIRHKLYAVDEVYSLQYVGHMEMYNMLYRGCAHIITDESITSMVPAPGMVSTQCRRIITTCYLNKLDYAEFPGRPWQVEHLQREYFQRIAEKCVQMYPWPLSVAAGQRLVILCATYVATWDAFTAERQRDLIDGLVKRGYHILYKPHPRDAKLPDESESLTLLRSRLPLECYPLKGVLAVVSVNSSACTQSYHYSRVPGFVDYAYFQKFGPEHISILAQEYTPPVEVLLGIDTAGLSLPELQQEIARVYHEHVDGKPMMSRNERFSRALRQALGSHEQS